MPMAAAAFPSRTPEIQVIDLESRQVVESWVAFPDDYRGGIQAVPADLDGDGKTEIVVGQSRGADAAGRLAAFTAAGTLLAEANAGVLAGPDAELRLAAGDVDGDGKDEVIVSRANDEQGTILILNESLKPDRATASGFVAFPDLPTAPAVTVGNLLGDERAEIIAATGAGDFPLVRILDESGQAVAPDISPFSEHDTHGLNVAAVNTGGGPYADLAIGYRNGAQTWVKAYRIDDLREYPVLSEFRVWPFEYFSGVQLAGIDVDGDGTEEIAVTPEGDQVGEVLFFRGDGVPAETPGLIAFEQDFRGGLHLAAIQADRDPAAELLVSPRHQRQRGDLGRGDRYVEVNLSQQAAYAWEGGYLRNAFRISSGLPATPTPVGDFAVSKKIANHLYSGPGYYLPNTPWNLRFATASNGYGYYLHTAYWHNNFGRPMSHGCVNMRLADAKFLYDWAPVGTPVWVHH